MSDGTDDDGLPNVEQVLRDLSKKYGRKIKMQHDFVKKWEDQAKRKAVGSPIELRCETNDVCIFCDTSDICSKCDTMDWCRTNDAH